MMSIEQKDAAVAILAGRFGAMRGRLSEIDERLVTYYEGLCVSPDRHNAYEVLGALKLLRLMDTYEMDVDKVHQVIRLREGVWAKVDGMWRHVSGGLRMPGIRGASCYRWEPFQVFILTAMYGPMAWVGTGSEAGSRPMASTERERGGMIEDLRRLCTDFTYYAPRKTDKTGLSAYNNFLFFMLEDADAEIYCCANASEQAKILYRRTQELIRQMDPNERRIRFTATETNWKPMQPRSAKLCALSAGGKTKDGLCAQLCCADEYGSASYVNGNSDMGNLVNVVLSSMGPRREPMLFTSTTAGTIKQGPFVDKLAGLKRELEKEVGYADGTLQPSREGDRWMCIILEPDAWEMDDEFLLTDMNVRYKVNPMLGVIVQHSFYDQAVADSRIDPLKKTETVCKLFNVYQTDTIVDWLTPEDIRPLQTTFRVDDCKADDGWVVFCGMDFSKGDDLNGVSYLAYNTKTGMFFGDMDSYMSEDAVNACPIRELLLSWHAAGWLHIVPGKTFDPAWPVNRIIELHGKGINFMGFGYDPYNSKIVMNALGQWVYGLGIDPSQVIIPVRQNYATYNGLVNEFDYLVKRSVQDASGRMVYSPLIQLSMNPMWPWEFGNCCLGESNDGNENRKPIKKNGSASCKVDNVQMLLSALMLYDIAEGKVSAV